MHPGVEKGRSSSTSRTRSSSNANRNNATATSISSPLASTGAGTSTPARNSPRTHSPLTAPGGAAERGRQGVSFGIGIDGKFNSQFDKTSGASTAPATGGASSFSPVVFKNAEILKLADDNFDVETYIHNILQQLPSEEAIRQLHNSLTDAREVAATDLQRNVFRNYNDFVIISKEISKLESDMLYLRGILSELRDVHDNLRPDAESDQMGMGDLTPSGTSFPKDGVDDPLATPEQKASAAAEALTRLRIKEEELMSARETQMKTLYTNIEGLQKMLPESKTRYIVREGNKARYWEVNAVTFKQKDMVHLYLFNDALVVVSWKKSIITGKTRMVAESHWNLSEIGFIDMKDSPDVTNAFKIVKHPDMNIYRAETLEEKRSILGAIKRITDEILAQKRREKESAKESSMTSNKTKSMILSMSAVIPDEDKQIRSDMVQVKDDLSATDYRWLVELPDELDVLIAHRDFEGAVSNIEKARNTLLSVNNDTPRVQALRASIEERTEEFARLICLDLASPVSTKTQVQENIDRLLRLGLGDQARDIFLSARTKTIRHRTRQLKFDGEIGSYISDLAEVTFRLIRNTCDWYGGSFRDTAMASGFMKWVTSEVIYFTDTLRRQVFDSHQSFSTIADCLLTTLDHCQQLQEVGLDLTFLLDRIVLEDIVKAIESHSESCVKLVREAITVDKFENPESRLDFFKERELTFDKDIPKMSSSAYEFFKILTDFASDVGVLMSMTLYNRLVSALSTMFSTYIEGLEGVMIKDLSTSQYSVILTNATFVAEQMLPKVKIQLMEQFERPIPELEEILAKHTASVVAMRERFVSQCTMRILKVDFNFSQVDYTNSAAILDTSMPSDAALKFVYAINKLVHDMDKSIGRKVLTCQILDTLFDHMATFPSCWKTDKGPRRFGFGGVQMLILDIHFALRAAEQCVTERGNELANSVCERALRAYFTQNKDLGAPLKTGEWYDKRVEEAMRKYGRNFGALNAVIE